MQPGEREVGLRLPAGNRQRAHSCTARPLGYLRDQHGLAHPRLAQYHQHAARVRDGIYQRPQPGQLGVAPDQTVIIGDTPRDIACARADGSHCIAISTGPFRATDLHGADLVIDMLRELPVALTKIPGLA